MKEKAFAADDSRTAALKRCLTNAAAFIKNATPAQVRKRFAGILAASGSQRRDGKPSIFDAAALVAAVAEVESASPEKISLGVKGGTGAVSSSKLTTAPVSTSPRDARQVASSKPRATTAAKPRSAGEFMAGLNAITDPAARGEFYRRHAAAVGFADTGFVSTGDPDEPQTTAEFMQRLNGLTDPAERAAFYRRHARNFGLT
jgi:hypothetical protein